MKPTRKKYARAVLRAAEKQGLEKVRYDEEKFAIVVEDVGQLNLENTYPDYAGVRQKYRQVVVDKVVSSWREAIMHKIPDDWVEARKKLMPVVRNCRFYNSLMRLHHTLKGEEWQPPESVAIAGNLEATVAYGFEHGMTVPSAKVFEKWGVSFEEAMKVAKANLRRATTGSIAKTDKGVSVLSWGDSYESSRVLLPEILHELDLKGDPVAMVPIRDILLVAGHEDEEALTAMVLGAEQFLDTPRWVSFRMYRHDGDSWSVFDPPFAEVEKALEKLILREKLVDHDQQKGFLDAVNEKESKDIMVAELRGSTAKDGGAITVCTLTQDVKSLLPVADRIVFERWEDGQAEPNDRARVSWQWAKERYFKDSEPVAELAPERYLVHIKSWTDEEWREIKELGRE